MPNIVVGNPENVYADSTILDKDLGYDYPYGLDLRPGSKIHDKIKAEVMTRARESHALISNRVDSWNQVERVMTAYVDLSEKEEDIKNSDSRKPVSIVFPYTYVILETVLTYLITVFLNDPIFRYKGSSPEDTIGTIMLEKVVQNQSNFFKVDLALYTFLRDSLVYGIGACAPVWKKRMGMKIRERKSGLLDFFRGHGERVYEEGIIYEGNKLENIDPYLYLPDPRVPSQKIQEGEYVGWIDKTSRMALLREEKNSDDMFNAKYLKAIMMKRSSIFTAGESDRNKKTGISDYASYDTRIHNPVDVIYMYVDLIPKEWELGTSEYPEKWLFGLGNDGIVLKAKKLGLAHGMYPIAVASPDFDGYSVLPLARSEMLYGMQTVLDWLFNCYDDQTEVLTDTGWKLIKDAQIDNNKVATVDPELLTLTFEYPKEWFEYDYEGYMMNFKSSNIDVCVTPNHNMFVKRRYERSGVFDEWQFKPAAFLGDTEYKTIGNVNWKGSQGQSVILEGVAPLRNRGKRQRYKDVEIQSDLLAGFLGWFLSEGSISHGKSSGSYAVAIKQSKGENYKDLDAIFDSMPFHVNRTYDLNKFSCQWTITDRRLYDWLEKNCYEGGTTGEFKKVPGFVRDWDEFTLKLLFDRAMAGDGHWIAGHSNLGQYGSKSKQLVDDMQEIAIKLGYFSHIHEGKTPLGDSFYSLNINTRSVYPTIAPRNCFKSKYKGKIYSFENSTHLTVTRRGGKIAVCGQSHIANVRKSINDMLVVDPYLVNIADLKDPEPGKLIRMRRPAWGKGVKDAVQQLMVNDITRGNIGDSAMIVQWMQKIGAADESMMGALRQGGPERLTGQEFQGTRAGAVGRLEKVAKVIGSQGMRDIAYMFASHNQQLMSQETYIDVVGTWQSELSAVFGDVSKLKVTPWDLLINYDVVVQDGSTPGNSDAKSWIRLYDVLSKNPELSKQFDMVRIFEHIATEMGAKNVQNFRINPKVVPDEVAMREREKGNIVPMEMGGMGGRM